MHAKQGLESLNTILGSLNGYTFNGAVKLGDNDYGFLFKKGMASKLAAWTSETRGKSVQLPANAAWFAPGSSRQIGLSGDVKVLVQK